MTILAATPDGLYRLTDGAAPERVLSVATRQVASVEDTVYAATASGLRVSRDTGRTWADAGLDGRDVQSIDGSAVAGTRPLAVYERRDGDWEADDGLRALAERAGWPTPSFREEAWARSVARDGGRLLVGVEVGGLALRGPDGRWRRVGPSEPDPAATQRCDDVHHVAVRARGEWLIATGDGIYRTTDAGATWTRLETSERTYARHLLCRDGQVYVAANDSPPRWDPPHAAAWVGTPDDRSRLPYPGAPERFLVSWAAGRDGVYAGANDGTVLRFDGRDAAKIGSVPVEDGTRSAYGVQSLAVV